MSTFEELKGSHDLDIPAGDNEQVLGLSYVQNAGQAIAEDEIYPAGDYIVHEKKGMYRILVQKESKVMYRFVIQVYDHIREGWEKQFAKTKEKWQEVEGEDKPTYSVPIWIVFDLALNHNVHPLLDEKAFEEVLWSQYPKLWIDESKAPKRIIT